jgi:hypothetical protein
MVRQGSVVQLVKEVKMALKVLEESKEVMVLKGKLVLLAKMVPEVLKEQLVILVLKV